MVRVITTIALTIFVIIPWLKEVSFCEIFTPAAMLTPE
jgi:hypothetical protein